MTTPATGVSTLALLERKDGISRDLFSRYWRDVHGVMAARIPGFATYTQHHVIPLTDIGSSRVERFEGIALVTYASEDDRAGLIHSKVTQHIHRDEQNVFRRALLYNLGAGFVRVLIGDRDAGVVDLFLVVPEGLDGESFANDAAASGAAYVALHDLTASDPGGWNDTDVEEGGTSRLFHYVIHTRWADAAEAQTAARKPVATSNGQIAAYRTEQRHVMVDGGVPTAMGLRGLDAVRTIEEAGAVNQLQPDVVQAVYGI